MVFQLVLWPHKTSFCINFYTMKSVKQLSIATQKQLIKSALRSSNQICSIDLFCLISYPAAGLSAYCSRNSFPSNLAEALFDYLQYGRTAIISGSIRTPFDKTILPSDLQCFQTFRHTDNSAIRYHV